MIKITDWRNLFVPEMFKVSDLHNKQSSDNMVLWKMSRLKFLLEIIFWTAYMKHACGSLLILNL